MCWANDQSRYGRRHKWQRKQALRNMTYGQCCTRCGKPLLPPEFETETGVYELPRGWLSRNIHLDHRDGSDTAYLGLAHAACNAKGTATMRAEPGGRDGVQL